MTIQINPRFLINPDRVAEGLVDVKTSSSIYQIIYPLSRPVPRRLPRADALESIDALARDMPHFVKLFDIVKRHIYLIRDFGGKNFTLPNLLLVGSPGIGKTYVMNQLASILGLSFSSIPMSLNNTRFALSGLERGWSSCRPGEIAQVVSKFECINGVLLLDEFDKCAWESDGNREGVTNPVLQLLERDTAAAFRDVAIEGDLYLAELSVLATANGVETIPEPVLSRLTTLNIPAPPVDALQKMTSSILTKAAKEDLGLSSITVVAEPCVAEVFNGSISPRTLRNQSLNVLFPLLSQKSNTLRVTGSDLRRGLVESVDPKAYSREIGFHAVFQ